MTTAAPAMDRWDSAPCGLLAMRLDGMIVEVNRTFLSWVDRKRDELVGHARLPDLLSVGGRIYWETHLSPLLHVEGRADEVALELVGPDGRLPVLLTAAGNPTTGLVQVVLSTARERSRYERELLLARRAAERAQRQVSALQSVTAALSQAVGLSGVAQALLAAATGPLGAAAGTLWLRDDERGLHTYGAQGEPARPVAPGAALQRGVAVEQDGRVIVPLHGSTTLQGVLSLAPSQAPAADPLDVEMLTAVGQQAGLALDRAHLYEQSASVARTLQQSLLEVEPPVDARFAVASAYRPGVEQLEVGGDWYDAFLAGDGVVSFVVGDVVGRGLHAASTMGQLRSAVRAVADAGVGPGELLSRLDHFVDRVQAAGMATLAYAELDLASGVLRYACAGHPPPVLLPAHGEPRLLWEGRSTPLGAFVTEARPDAGVQLAAGDRLLLYTDGLVERRDRGLDHGLDLLLQTAAPLRAVPLPDAVRELTAAMLQDQRSRDDVCVLLLEWVGARFERRLSADLAGLGAVRAGLAGWLQDNGVSGDTCRDVVHATSEAVANAAEHGCGGRSTEQVTVRAALEQGRDGMPEVVVSVHDAGRWRTPTASVERGRGLMIIAGLVDDVLVEAADGTTVVMRRRVRERAP